MALNPAEVAISLEENMTEVILVVHRDIARAVSASDRAIKTCSHAQRQKHAA